MLKMIHRFLKEESYWAKDISYALVDHSLTHSFCIGAFVNGEQVGFGRVITDYYTFGWFADFFVLSEYRGKGISKKMLSHILEQPWSKRLRRKMLNTSDAHGLYRQFQFIDLANPSYNWKYITLMFIYNIKKNSICNMKMDRFIIK